MLLQLLSESDSMVAGPTKATAYINLTKDNVVGQILLSVHGKDEDPTVENFDSLRWNEYEFQRKGFNYDKNIELIVKRN